MTSVLDDLARDLIKAGVVGVESQAKAIYLCNISRKLGKPQSFIAYGPSAAGKSFLADTMLELVPNEDVERFDSASATALFYGGSLAHKIVYVPETANLSEDLQGLLRVLVSEGSLSRDFTAVEGTKRRVIHVEREGPCLVAQTSVDSIHPENETRALLIEVPDSPTQTRRVMESIAAQFTGAVNPIDPEPWLRLDASLPVAPKIEVDPGLANPLAKLIPSASVRMRRDFRAILTLVCAHALLHYTQRPVNPVSGATVAGMEDYEVVREVLEPIIGVQTDRAVHIEVREFVDQAVAMAGARGLDGTVTAKEVGDALGIDKRTAWRRAKRALRGEFLVNGETRRGQPAKLSAGSPMPDGIALPTVAAIKEWVGAQGGGTTRSTAGSNGGSRLSGSGSSDSSSNEGTGEDGNGETPGGYAPYGSEDRGTGGTATRTSGTGGGHPAESSRQKLDRIVAQRAAERGDPRA